MKIRGECDLFQEKIFQGVFDGAESVSTILHSYSPFPEGAVKRVSLCKTKKILNFLQKNIYFFSLKVKIGSTH